MATPRLPFLYPNLMRAVRSCEPSTYRSIRLPSSSSSPGFHTSRRSEQEPYPRRYGPAVEPNLPPPSRPKERSSNQPADGAATTKEGTDSTEQKNAPPGQSQSQPQGAQQDTASGASSSSSSTDQQAAEESKKTNISEEPDLHEEHAPENDDPRNAAASATSPSADSGEERPQVPPHMSQSAFDDVLHMPSPSADLAPIEPSSSDSKPPHLTPGPYVHHFDTYSLVQDLAKGGFSKEHSTTIMKAMRNILQNNLDLAKQSLTSKSDVENESYLFKAACSELQQSLQTARNSEVQRQRAARTQLQHEADILSQRLNQELAGMKDDIKGMFNDHNMATREQSRSIDTSVQELNYKITVSLNSDGKSEIEGMRWILTRRAAFTVATCAFMIIVFLKYASTRKQDSAKKEEAAKPIAKEVTETRIVHDAGVQTEVPSVPETQFSESLG